MCMCVHVWWVGVCKAHLHRSPPPTPWPPSLKKARAKSGWKPPLRYSQLHTRKGAVQCLHTHTHNVNKWQAGYWINHLGFLAHSFPLSQASASVRPQSQPQPADWKRLLFLNLKGHYHKIFDPYFLLKSFHVRFFLKMLKLLHEYIIMHASFSPAECSLILILSCFLCKHAGSFSFSSFPVVSTQSHPHSLYLSLPTCITLCLPLPTFITLCLPLPTFVTLWLPLLTFVTLCVSLLTCITLCLPLPTFIKLYLPLPTIVTVLSVCLFHPSLLSACLYLTAFLSACLYLPSLLCACLYLPSLLSACLCLPSLLSVCFYLPALICTSLYLPSLLSVCLYLLSLLFSCLDLSVLLYDCLYSPSLFTVCLYLPLLLSACL